MSQEELTPFLKDIDKLDRLRENVMLAAFDSLAMSDPELVELAIETFDGRNMAAAWFAEKVFSLGNEMPLKLLIEGKREQVLDCLNQIRYGMWA